MGTVMKLAALAVFMVAGSPVQAQIFPVPQILVSASGTVKTAPDMVTVGFTLRGEGTTSDDAAAKLRDSAKTVRVGVKSLLHGAEDDHASNFSMAQVRSKDCDQNSYGQQRLSTGACAIIGYIATLPVTIDTPRVRDAGTLVALIGRLGGLDARLRNFWLKDDTGARKSATQAALASALAQATLIAEGAGGRLGALLRVQDAEYREISLAMAEVRQSIGAMGEPFPPPPPPAPPPPVRIDLAPEPIQTTVRVMAAYGITLAPKDGRS